MTNGFDRLIFISVFLDLFKLFFKTSLNNQKMNISLRILVEYMEAVLHL